MLLFCLSNTIGYAQASDFVTKWDLSKTGTAGNNSISFYTTNAAGSVAYTWQEISPGSSSGSGSFSSGTAASRSITGLPANAIIELRMAATNLQRFYISFGTDKLRLTDITQWGTVAWTSMEDMFYGCNNMTASAIDIPDLSNLTSMDRMFYYCVNLNGPSNINNWNTSTVTSMSRLFSNTTLFNQNVGNWNTANVINMGYMFNAAQAFNQNIGSWNTNKVTDMRYMFYNAKAFNQNIGNWNTANVTNMGFLLYGTTAFNQNIGNWNTAKVTNMESLFQSAQVFNQNIGNWNTTNVTNMRNLFNAALAFNQNIGSWNTAKVTNMNGIFYTAAAFNQNIGNWNVSSVTDLTNAFRSTFSFNQSIGNWNTANVVLMNNIFMSSSAFNQDIGNWNTSKVTDMSNAFTAATAFNQNIGNWNTHSVTNMRSMFSGASVFNQNLGKWILNPNVNVSSMLNNCGMDCDNYSRTLSGWTLSTSATGRSLGATGLTYGTNVTSLRSLLTLSTSFGGKGWTISGDAAFSGTCGSTIFYSKSTGNLDDLATWGANTDGTGTTPSNFTSTNQVFCIRNRSSASIAAPWSVSGTNSLVIVGDGSTAITFSTGSNTIGGRFKVTNNATLVLESNTSGLDIMCETGAAINYNSSSAQTIIEKFGYYHLIVSGSNLKTLDGNILILGDLTLNNKLVLNQYTLSITGTISGASSSNYIQTNSTGTLNKSVAASSTFIFPVGNSAYNPISITNNNSSADIFSLRVLDEVYYGGTTGNIVTEPRVKRTWIVGKSNTNTGSGVNFVFNWNNGEETGGITNHKLYQYDGSAWQKQSGTTTVSGRSLTYTSYNGTLAPFAVGDDGIPLPVSWLDMHCDGSMVQWSTAYEKNSCLFLIERSINAETFETIGSLPAAGESPSIRNYSFQDPYPKPEASYYRVRMVDVAGKSTVSTVCGSSSQSRINLPAIIIYPNPTSGVLIIKSIESGTKFGYSLFTASGRLVLAGKSTGGVTHVQMEDFNDGVYHLNIAGSGNTTNHKIVLKH